MQRSAYLMRNGRQAYITLFLLGTLLGIAVFLFFAFLIVKDSLALRDYRERPVVWEKETAPYRPAVQPAGDVSGKPQNKKRLIAVKIDAGKRINRISPLLYGSNLAPKMESDEKIKRFIKDIGLTVFRFPGGGSPGYHWKEGRFDFEGPSDAPLSNIDNLIAFLKDVGAQLVVQVNVESGTPQEAAEWVKYMNKEKGFYVRYWELGNEVYGSWDRAHTDGESYGRLVNEYSAAMKAVDPTIKIGANWGGERYNAFDEALIQTAGANIDFFSVHWYPNHTKPGKPWQGREHPLPYEVLGNTGYIDIEVNRIEKMVKRYVPEKAGRYEIAYLEWDGAWDAPSSDTKPYSQGIVAWSLVNAIFYADVLGKFAERGISVSAQFDLQETGFGLIRGWDKAVGWGGQEWDGRTIRPKAFAIQLFSKYFRGWLVKSEISPVPTAVKDADWWNGSYAGRFPLVSVYTADDDANSRIAVMIVNKDIENAYTLNMNITGRELKPEAKAFVLTADGPLAQNDGSPGKVQIKEAQAHCEANECVYTAPKHSVSAIVLGYNKKEDGL